MLKAYYVIRTDLNMPASKLAVQVGHGTQLIMENTPQKVLEEWVSLADSRKIICTCSSEEKLIKLLHKIFPACSHVFGCTIIEDSGYTFFKERTRTGIAFLADVDAMSSSEDESALKAIKRLQTWKD